MIIDMRRERCVHFPSEKFFKLDERPETRLEVLLARGEPEIVEKIDGSMVSCFRQAGTVRWACKGNFDVEQSRRAEELMRESVLSRMDFDRYSYVFEIVYPENLYPKGFGIVDYQDITDLFLIFMRDKSTNEPLSYREIIQHARELGVSHPEVFTGSFRDAVQTCGQKTTRFDREGYVARFGDSGFVKVKYAGYKHTLHVCNQLRSHAFLQTYVAMTSDVRQTFLGELPAYVREIALERIGEFESRILALEERFALLRSEMSEDPTTFVRGRVEERLQKAFFRYLRGQDYRSLCETYIVQQLQKQVNDVT